MDQANYGGMSIPLPKALSHNEGEGEGEEEEESEVMEIDQNEGQRSGGMEMNWNIRQYLPQAGSCQELFNVSVLFPIL